MKRIRKAKKIKQAYIAKKLSVSQVLVSCWETGKREPSISVLPKLAEILGCSIEEVVYAIIESQQG